MSVRIGVPEPRQLAQEMQQEARKLQADTGLGRLAIAELIAQWADIVNGHYEKRLH